jgi:hypothetical protein
MNSDQDIIKAAYETAIADLYAKLFGGYAEAAGDAEKEQQADQHFTAAVGLTRNARDRANALLPSAVAP